MKIYIDGELPKSCASCQFLVHCDQCEGTENYCPFVGCVGYDPSDTLINSAPITPTGKRHEECPLVQMPHGEWIEKYHERFKYYCSRCESGTDREGKFCDACGADMRKEGEQNE